MNTTDVGGERVTFEANPPQASMSVWPSSIVSMGEGEWWWRRHDEYNLKEDMPR
jgi:hypothetical protein